MSTVEIEVASPLWAAEPDAEDCVREALAAAARACFVRTESPARPRDPSPPSGFDGPRWEPAEASAKAGGGDPALMCHLERSNWIPTFAGMSGACGRATEGEISVLLADDAAVRALNRTWRGIDRPTNVLSFPAAAPPPGSPALLGDIAIAYETLAREAEDEGKPLLHHLAHLMVHGYLHLIGYDHQTDSEADAMEALEREILLGLRIPDPYRAIAPDAA